MGSTEYARAHLLRLDDADRQLLATLVMRGIEGLNTSESPLRGPTLNRLRSLLERLTNQSPG